MRRICFTLLAGTCAFTCVLLLWWQSSLRSMAEQTLAERHDQETETGEMMNSTHLMVSGDVIKRISNSTNLMVSAFKEHRRGGAIRVISIIKRKEVQKLYCVLCLRSRATGEAFGQCAVSEANVDIHPDHFNFPYHTSDILCTSPSSMEATHVSITADPNTPTESLEYLPIQNKEIKNIYKYNFTVCISNLFGDFNNALQVVQTFEVYKLIGVQRVVIYNTSCGPDLDKVLKHYMKEGMLEVVPWPIHKFLKPSAGFLPERDPGDLHYYGQTTTLNDCMYRYMYESRYLLLNDIDEIIMPYKHTSLGDLMDALQKQHPAVGVFMFDNRVYTRSKWDGSGRFNLSEWSSVPGVNILPHIYNQPYDDTFKQNKMIIDPRRVEQTAVHKPLRPSGPYIFVPFNVCHLIHVCFGRKTIPFKKELYEDKKLWDFEEKLIPNINHALHKSGLIGFR